MRVEIWSDVVCPWCYIGKRRFETAVAKLEEDVEVVWRSFELDPGAPAESEGPIEKALAKKYRMSEDRARQMIDNMVEMGRGEGLEFDFEQASGANTFDAHRLIHFAHERGVGPQMKERLLRAHFTEGRGVSDRDVLRGLAGEIGLDEEAVGAMLTSDAFADAVRRDEREAMELGVRGVPFFLIEGKYAVPGAQLPDVFEKVFARVKAS